MPLAVMPVRIMIRVSARSLGPLRNLNAATVTSCKYPALPASFCYRKTKQKCEKPARHWRAHWQF
jgi:hypothetical protein